MDAKKLTVKASIKITTLIVFIALIGWMSYELYSRSAQQLLWGYRPLLLLLAAWGLIVVLTFKKNKLLAWSSLSGVLLGLSFPGWIPVPFLMFGALIPLLFVEHEIEKTTDAGSHHKFSAYTFNTFIIWNIVSTFWITNSSLFAGIFAILANSALMIIPFALSHQSRRIMRKLGYAPLIAYWLVFEYLHYNWELNYPWLTLGNSFAQFPGMVQWYEFTGVFGGSLWILIANVLLFDTIKKVREKEVFRGRLLQAGALLVLPLAFSLFLYFSFNESAEKINVVVVQPNFEPHYEESANTESTILERNLGLANAAITENTDFLIFPEATFGPMDESRMTETSVFQEFQSMMRAHPKLKIISGVSAYHVFLGFEEVSDAARVDTSRSGKIIQYEMMNAAMQFSPNSQIVPIHRKSKLVPGPESFPFKRFLFFLTPIIERFGGTTAGLGVEENPVIFDNETVDVAPLICYESVFGEYVTRYVRAGAEVIFIMTNDGWWDNTPGHRQHLYFASLRAIETRRAIARAANTGVSAFINQRGEILSTTAYGETTTLTGSIGTSQAQTFYMRWGDMIGRLALFAAAIFILNTLARSFMPKKKEN